MLLLTVQYQSVKKTIILLLLMFTVCSPQALATISGAPGVYLGGVAPWNTVFCDAMTGSVALNDSSAYIKGNACNLQLGSEDMVPVSGMYSVRLTVSGTTVTSSQANFDASRPINQQNIRVSSSDSPRLYSGSGAKLVSACYYLVASTGQVYGLSPGCGTPLPPPAPPIACTINNGNTFSVNFGEIDRTTLPTKPGGEKKLNKEIPVICTGGDVTMNMKVSYIPVSMNGTELIKTSTDGLGVAISYNGQTLTTTDTKEIGLLEGSNTLLIGFEALRNSAIAAENIATGTFTASATMIMTQP